MIRTINYCCILVLIIWQVPTSLHSQEICDNAVDDDQDGLIDLYDDECTCDFIEIRSLIANPSFEEMSCCPDQHYRLDCAGPWIQALGHTPDYIHTCGYSPPDIQVPLPFPDGDAIVGFANGQVRGDLPIEYEWKEYAVTCLPGPMKANVSYRIEFSLGFSSLLRSPPLDFTIFGSEDCANYPYGSGQAQLGCPSDHEGWIRLDNKLLEPSSEPTWVDDYFEFTPDRDIRILAIGPPCELFEGINTEYYFLDNLIMEETFKFLFQIQPSGDFCTNDVMLSVTASDTLEYQWYKDSIALLGETGSELKIRNGSGNYQVRMINEDGCLLSPPYKYEEHVPIESFVTQTICPGETYIDSTFSTTEEGSYQYVLTSVTGCDSTINLTLEPCEFYVPTIFSPNGDGTNDNFQVFGKDNFSDYSMTIFNRWGNVVYRGPSWDGTIDGSNAPSGVYTYIVEFGADSSGEPGIKGTVTLIR